MTERIFISYRRDDSAGHAGRVFDRLRADFKDSVLFMDVDAIPLGSNFVRAIRDEVQRCNVLLAIIGPRWLEAMDDDGSRRLDNPNDFVRVEIAAALARDIPVIPILLEGARIPKAMALPADLQELSQRNGLDVRHASFHADMDKLVRGLRTSAPPKPADTPAKPSAPPAPPPAVARPQFIVPQKPRIAPPPVGDRLRERLGYQPAAPLPPVPTADEVIAAQGKWLKDFNVSEYNSTAPEIFQHLFMQVFDINMKERDYSGPGTIFRGSVWSPGKSPGLLIVHGPAGSLDIINRSLDWLAYLGPTWRSEYARLSAEVFKKLRGVRLQRFIEHP